MKWHHREEVLINKGDTYLDRFGRIFSVVILTFAIPLLQWLTNKLIGPSGYSTLMGNIFLILVLSYWSVRSRLFSYYPVRPVGRVLLYLMGISVLILLILNVQSRSVSGITGQPRSTYEIVDVMVLGSIAEELVFRGVVWSLFQQVSKAKAGDANITALVSTSILFGVEHLGYWVQSYWPLPSDAYIHSISMIFAGVFFGVFRLKTKSLTIPVIVHMLANGIILLFQ